MPLGRRRAPLIAVPLLLAGLLVATGGARFLIERGGAVTVASAWTRSPVDKRPLPAFQPKPPIRAAFYYIWYPEAWKQKGYACGQPPRNSNPPTPSGCFTRYHPRLGFYDSASTAVIRQHIRLMQYGRIAAGIVSWWGPGTRTDRRFRPLLRVADRMRSRFRWAIYYEPEGQGDPAASTIASDLAYIKSHYARDRAYLKVNGKFVVFVYGPDDKTCAYFSRWHDANAAIGFAAYLNLDLTFDAQACGDQPSASHLYGPAQPIRRTSSSFAVSAGFWKASEATARLDRDPTSYAEDVSQMVDSQAPWQLVTTFNEWGEGTAIEPAREWKSGSHGVFLQILRANPQH